MRFWRRFEGVFGGDFWMRGFGWGGEEEEEEGIRRRRREGVDEKGGGEGEGDEKREKGKGKLNKERVGRIQNAIREGLSSKRHVSGVWGSGS